MKPTVIDPKTTTRAEAYALWMDAPNPMVTFFKTLDVAPLIRFSRRRGMKFNMLLCFCIGKAASEIKEFYMLPVGRELLKYDTIAVNTIVKNKNGEVSSCDVPFSDSLAQFNADYLRLTRQVAERCENHDFQSLKSISEHIRLLKNCANLWNGKAQSAQNCNPLELQSICLGELPIPVFCYPWLD